MIGKLSVALVCALLTLTAFAVAAAHEAGVPLRFLIEQAFEPDRALWGFELRFEDHPDDADVWCGTCKRHGSVAVWYEGPRGDFGRHEPRELARRSLAWCRRTLARAEWRDRVWRWLELEYASGALTVRVQHPAGSDVAWPDQLEAWFERFPPTPERSRPHAPDAPHVTWRLTFGDLGSVDGCATSESEALARLRSTAEETRGSSAFGPVVYGLGATEPGPSRIDPDAVVTNCYSVETDDPDAIDRLPEMLAEKRAYARSLFSGAR